MQPTHAERARTIVATAGTGTLSTLAREPQGHPFGSLTPYALDADGHPLLLLSRLAEHTMNLEADPRASLLAVEPPLRPDGDPLAGGRVTLLGEARRTDDPAARAAYLSAHPEAEMYVDFADFGFFRLEVGDVRYVGGFGRMSWVDADGYLAAEADPVAPIAASVVEHMEHDHADSMVACAVGLGGIEAPVSVSMGGVDRYGFELVVETADGPRPLRCDFDAPVASADQVRHAVVAVVRRARQAMAGEAAGAGAGS